MKFDVRKLVCLMAAQGLSAKKLTEAAGIGANTVREIVKYGRKPTIVTVGKIAAALNVEPGVLLKKED